MDMTPVVFGMLKPLLWLLPLVVASSLLRSSWFKGWLGERKVRTLLREHLDQSVYREFHNLTLRDEFGDTTQIDHVYVSRFGVFVLETKHLSHWIFGGRHDPRWTQQHFRSKVSFQNPLRQNYRHSKVLASLLGLPDDVFRSVVVLTGNAEFKTPKPEEVRTCSDLVGYLRSFDAQVLTAEQVALACLQLQDARLEPTWRTHREHVDNLRRRHGATAQLEAAPSRGRADAFAEAAGERLLRAVEDRVRGGSHRRVSGAAQFGLAAIAAKALLGLAAIALVWWALARVGDAVRPLQPPQVVAAPPSSARTPEPVPFVQAQIEPEPGFDEPIPEPVERKPTAAELAENRRRAEEAARILERSTPEIPLALPGSPAVGPSAYPEDGARSAGQASPER